MLFLNVMMMIACCMTQHQRDYDVVIMISPAAYEFLSLQKKILLKILNKIESMPIIRVSGISMAVSFCSSRCLI